MPYIEHLGFGDRKDLETAIRFAIYRVSRSWVTPWNRSHHRHFKLPFAKALMARPLQNILIHSTWMSQEVSKWLVSGFEPQYTPFISRLKPIYKPFTNFLGHPSRRLDCPYVTIYFLGVNLFMYHPVYGGFPSMCAYREVFFDDSSPLC